MLWNFETGVAVNALPTITENTVYVSHMNNAVYAFDKESGDRKWRYLTDSFVSSSPAVFDGVIYFGSADTTVYALEEP